MYFAFTTTQIMVSILIAGFIGIMITFRGYVASDSDNSPIAPGAPLIPVLAGAPNGEDLNDFRLDSPLAAP
jgi:hypothetical protein